MSKAEKSTSHVVAVSAGVVPAEVSRHVMAAIGALPPGMRLHVRPTAAHEGAASTIFLGREGLEAVADAAGGILDAESEVEDVEETDAPDGGAAQEPRSFTFQEGPLAGTRVVMTPIRFGPVTVSPDCKVTVSFAAADVPSAPAEKQAPSLPPELERFRFLGEEWRDRAAGIVGRLSYCRPKDIYTKAQHIVAHRRDNGQPGYSVLVIKPGDLRIDTWTIDNQKARVVIPGMYPDEMFVDLLMFDAAAVTSEGDIKWLRRVADKYLRCDGPIVAFLPPLAAS